MDLKFKDNSQLKFAPFTQLEYIESTGTQYIDTNFKPNNNTRVICEFNDLNNSYPVIFGSRIANGNSQFFYICGDSNSNGARFGSYEQKLAITKNTKLTLDANKNIWTLSNGNTTTFSNHTFQSNYNCVLFGFNDGGNINTFSIRIFSFKLYDNDVLVCDLLPVSDNNDIVCMYDTVSETFFYNEGTGNFIAGPKVPPTITILPDDILLKTNTLYHKNIPNVDGLLLLDSILNAQEEAEDVVLNRVRVDIGNVSGSITELLQYAGMAGFNDNYEPQAKPRLVGTWTINDWYTSEQFTQVQAAFDGLTIVGDPNYLINFDDLAVQTLDSTKPNYNPAVAIILQTNGKGTTLDVSPSGQGRYMLTKSQASSITSIGTWFRVTSVYDSNGIVSSDTTAQYQFNDFIELKYFTGMTSLVQQAFAGCTNLTRIGISNIVRNIGWRAFQSCNVSIYYYGTIDEYLNITVSEQIATSIKLYVNEEEVTSLSIPSNTTILKPYIFTYNKSLNSVIFHDNITSIQEGCFSQSGLTGSIVLPNDLESLGNSAFYNCTKISAVTFNDNIKTIGTSAFYGIRLEGLITLPNTLTSIGANAFFNAPITVHLLAINPPAVTANNSFWNAIKIYVGDGSSSENDNTILDSYLGNSNWATYSNKLDTWYNYLHPQV